MTAIPSSGNVPLDRRRFLALLGVALAWGLLPGCEDQPPSPLRLAAHTWPGYESLFLAHQMEWLDARLVQLTETTSATDSLRALEQGTVDAAALTLDEVLRARSRGIALSIVLVFDISAGADALLAHPDIPSLKDLAGKRVGVEDGALGALMLSEVLQKAGLSLDQVRQVSLTPEHQLDAWKRGEIDAVVTYEPVATQLQELGAKRLFDSREIPDEIVDVLAVRTSILEARGGKRSVRHLIAAHFQALNHLHTSPDDFSYRTAAHLKLPADEVLDAYTGLLLPDVARNHRLLSGSQPVLLGGARKLSSKLFRDKLIPAEDTLDALLRTEFLPEEAS